MSAASNIIATALATWRNAIVTSMMNRSDPFNTITGVHAMNQCLPPDFRLKPEEIKTEMPKTSIWFDDPDDSDYTQSAWIYIREIVPKMEGKITHWVIASKGTSELE